MRVGIAGLGGFAGAHHEAVRALEEAGECRLVSTCDPSLASFEDKVTAFGLRERGVRLYTSLDEMLAEEIDVACLPTPIPLHANQHAAVVRSGTACYLEKPPTLWWPEYQGMLHVEEQATKQTNVGFNFVGDPMRKVLKKRIVSGGFGKVLGASMLALWPRDHGYYKRNDWAGKMKLHGKPVMDSPMGNAVSHFVHDLFFWCGDENAIAGVSEVQASLLHAHPIESFDTAFVSATTENGKWLRIGVTHTGTSGQRDRETIECERAKIVIDSWRTARVLHADGREESLESPHHDYGDVVRDNLRDYFAFLRGEMDRPTTRLIDCEGFVALHNLAFLSSGGVEEFASDRLRQVNGQVKVEGLEGELDKFVDHGVWPDDRKMPPVATNPQLAKLRDPL